ncbi:prevent-host-death protein [Leucobacter chromiireducens]|uniref:prevent-host-death protein n=1 Tax=Leucobacter chromiireducens TaxID=283877 RepID=UPI0013DE71F8|nr:prevent-host-death protein [Leucobacter chromiireducens]
MSHAPAADYPTFSSARTHLKEVLDRARAGQMVTVSRGSDVSAVVSATKLRDFLFRTVPPLLEIAHEEGRVIALMRSRPFVSEGRTVDDALADMVESLREYAADWRDHLTDAPNHAEHWPLVQLILLSTDDELRDWFEHGGA